MYKIKEFVIRNGVLLQYKGSGDKAAVPDGVVRIGNRAFYGLSRLKSVTIPDGVTGIGDEAFGWCRGLRDVRIPDSVKAIGKEAFKGCRRLTDITIPEGVTDIGTGAFSGCIGLADRDGFVILRDTLYGYCGHGGDVTIPDSVKRIEKKAFMFRNDLESITIPNRVISIGESAFHGCGSLKDLTIPAGVKEIGPMAFLRCSGLKSVMIPEGVKSIGHSAFCGCTGLKSVTISEGVKSIGHSAFDGCSGLESVTIPGSVTEIRYRAFYACSSLTAVLCRSPYAVSCMNRNGRYPVYLAGPLSDLPEEERDGAVRGFLCAFEQGITEIDRWREGYLDHIRGHIRTFADDSKENRFTLLFLIGEKLLDGEETGRLLDYFDEKGDVEAKAVLLQYRNDNFGTGGSGNFSI